jgi:O-antigen/teichoic acid export membrane protein
MDPESRFPEAPFWQTREYLRKAGRTSGALWAAHAMAFAASVIAARALGPTAYGAVVLVVGVASLIAAFLDLTLEEGVVYHGSQALERGRVGVLRGLLRSALTVDALIGVAVSGGIVLAAGPIASLVGGGELDPALVRLAALMTLASTVNGTTGAVLLLAGRPDLRAVAVASASAARVVLVLVAVWMGGARAILGAFVASAVLGAALQALLAWRNGWRGWTVEPPAITLGPSVRMLARYAIHSSLATSINAMQEALLPIVLGGLTGPRTVGIFAVALLPLRAAGLLIEPFRQAVYPEQAKLAAHGDKASLRRSIRVHVGASLLVGVAGAVAGWFLLPGVISLLYSSVFAPAVDPARILLIAAASVLAYAWFKTLAIAAGRPEVRTRMTFLVVGMQLILFIALAGRGATGAAIAVTIAHAVGGGVWFWLAPRLLALPRSSPPQPAA